MENSKLIENSLYLEYIGIPEAAEIVQPQVLDLGAKCAGSKKISTLFKNLEILLYFELNKSKL